MCYAKLTKQIPKGKSLNCQKYTKCMLYSKGFQLQLSISCPRAKKYLHSDKSCGFPLMLLW